jgi:hypothetical protein
MTAWQIASLPFWAFGSLHVIYSTLPIFKPGQRTVYQVGSAIAGNLLVAGIAYCIAAKIWS